MLEVLKNLLYDENGQGMVEYGLVLGVLSAGAIIFILALRHSVEDLVSAVVNKIASEIPK